jgi:hypothetical protein
MLAGRLSERLPDPALPDAGLLEPSAAVLLAVLGLLAMLEMLVCM